MNNEFYRIKALENLTAKDLLENMSGFNIIYFAYHRLIDLKDPFNNIKIGARQIDYIQ